MKTGRAGLIWAGTTKSYSSILLFVMNYINCFSREACSLDSEKKKNMVAKVA